MTTVNHFQPLTIITKLCILDVVAVLDPPVTIAICNNGNMVLVYLHFMDLLHIIKKKQSNQDQLIQPQCPFDRF